MRFRRTVVVNVAYGNLTEIETRRLGNLAIVAPLLERMNVKKIFNQHLPSGSQLDFDYGTVLELLIAARLFGPTPLSRVTEWAEESGAELVFGVPAAKLNDDRLGRALDQLFTQRHSILASISLHVAEAFDIPLDALHYDPTHLVFTGAYEQSEPRQQRAVTYDKGEMSIVGDADLQAIHITKGKPVDDAPTGCRMAHFGLATFVDQHGPVPMTGHMLDGNENGRSGMEEQLGLIVKYLKPAELTVISDRGTYSVAHMLRMNDQGFKAICSVPWSDVKSNSISTSQPWLGSLPATCQLSSVVAVRVQALCRWSNTSLPRCSMSFEIRNRNARSIAESFLCTALPTRK